MIAAISFLTSLGRGRRPSETTLGWFPLVGAVIGVSIGLAWWGANQLWPPLVAAALVVALDVALTGGLHMDGLADTADGVLPHLERDRRLAVMAEPGVGAFGVSAVGLALVVRVCALAAIEPDVALIAAIWCASRTTMAVAARAVPYARAEGGLASAFLGRSPGAVACGGGVLAAGLAVVATSTGSLSLPFVGGLLSVAAVAIVGAGVIELAVKRLGGFTGDVLGAAGLVGETAGLLVAAARW